MWLAKQWDLLTACKKCETIKYLTLLIYWNAARGVVQYSLKARATIKEMGGPSIELI